MEKRENILCDRRQLREGVIAEQAHVSGQAWVSFGSQSCLISFIVLVIWEGKVFVGRGLKGVLNWLRRSSYQDPLCITNANSIATSLS